MGVNRGRVSGEGWGKDALRFNMHHGAQLCAQRSYPCLQSCLSLIINDRPLIRCVHVYQQLQYVRLASHLASQGSSLSLDQQQDA